MTDSTRLVAGASPISACILLLASWSLQASEQPDAVGSDPASLMDRSWRSTLVTGADSKATFVLTGDNGAQQIRKVSSYMKLQAGKTDNRRMTRFDFPADARGIATLLIDHTGADDELWLYIPAAKKVRRVVASDKKSSFMGTDLSYGDVLGYKVSAWSHRLTGEDVVDGRKCRVVESTPTSDSVRDDSGYSKRQTCVDDATSVALKIDIWDIDGKPLKTIWNRSIEPVNGQQGVFVAREIDAKNLQSGHSTKITIDDFNPTKSIPEDQFSPRALEE
ncbi:MAG: outer membrane lipoprotein-sorting protein [Kiritimatiellae bacterium]|nr:outer membrane lipoprotein-sorting protein [Kiritimatiellia bacterium]